MKYALRVKGPARRDLERRLPEAVAVAIWEFMSGPLVENPQRVGKPLRDDLEGTWAARRGQYRILYQILEEEVVVEVVKLSHRGHAYD